MKILNQQHLLQWLEQSDVPPSVKQNIDNGNVDCLGFFKQIPSSPNPGWIVRIKGHPERLIVVSVPLNERYYFWWIKTLDGCK
jgi:hypothetical protein